MIAVHNVILMFSVISSFKRSLSITKDCIAKWYPMFYCVLVLDHPQKLLLSVKLQVYYRVFQHRAIMIRFFSAALQSVFPQTELGTFMALSKLDKEKQLKELTNIVTGIRLFNRDCGKGGEGIDDRK